MDRDYFEEAMKGKTIISDLVISKPTGNPIGVIAAPIWNEERQVIELIGVLLASIIGRAMAKTISKPIIGLNEVFMKTTGRDLTVRADISMENIKGF
ncbi:hypothetical protein QBE52_05510 [Clostridiaceae bacterium 35-E11]